MPEVEHATLAHDHEPRAIDYIGFAIEQRPQQAPILTRVIFQIRVLDDAVIPARLLDSRTDRRSFATVAVLADQPDLRVARGHLSHNVARAIGRTVINH